MAIEEEETITAEVDTLDQGLRLHKRLISGTFNFAEASRNVAMGLYAGAGPRYGMQPLPFHNQKELVSPSGSPGGTTQCELGGATNSMYNTSLGLQGIVPISLRDPNTPAIFKTYDMFITTSQRPGQFGQELRGAFSLGCALDGTRAAYIRKDLLDEGLEGTTADGSANVATIPPINNYFSGDGEQFSYGKNKASKKYTAFASISVPGADLPTPYLYFRKLVNGDATIGATFYLYGYTGAPSQIEFNNYDLGNRFVNQFDVTGSQGQLIAHYVYNESIGNGTYRRTFNFYPDNQQQVFFPSNAPRVIPKLTGVPAYATDGYSIFNDPQLKHNSAYQLVAEANGQAFGAVVFDWMFCTTYPASTTYRSTIQVEFTRVNLPPPIVLTREPSTFPFPYYTENSIQKQTCWSVWPSFVEDTPLIKNSAAVRTDFLNPVTLGDAGSGLLRAGTVYELAFSYFDKSINQETNIGTPALIQTGTDDFVAISLWRNSETAGISDQYATYSGSNNNFRQSPIIYNQLNMNAGPLSAQTIINKVNYLQIRVYYRARGSFEWLPALTIDAAQYFYYPNFDIIWMCENAAAQLPAGQPGGFNDYSPLSIDTFIDVKTFANRLFWCSNRSLYYSDKDAPFSYPALNAVPCPAGSFKGMIAHTYPGQSEQSSRLVIFGTELIYVGQFKGESWGQTIPVRVSPDDVIEFFRPGSDFIVDNWTSFTAFSSRSAIVAEGLLYYWGPQGIFLDIGSEIPKKISLDIEPWIFKIYDSSRVDEIHSVYNSKTKEIMWFFPGNTSYFGNSNSKALVYNTEKEEFYPVWDFGTTDITWSQRLNTLTGATVDGDLNGDRIIIGIDGTFVRPAFFDDKCESGDLQNGNMYLVKQVSNVSATVRRLTLAAGSTGSLPSVGDLININDYKVYRNVTTPNADGLYPVAAVGANTIDITITGLTPPTTETITDQRRFFPVQSRDVHGFSFWAESNYFCPWGVKFWGKWEYCHGIYKIINIPPSNAIPYQISHKYTSLISDSFGNRDITMTDNSRGHFQVLNHTVWEDQKREGQALKFVLTTPTGKHFAGSYFLQYLSFDVVPMEKSNLAIFEG